MPFFTENRRHPKTGYNIHRPDLMSRDQSVGSEQVISYYKPGLMTKFFEQQNDIKRRVTEQPKNDLIGPEQP